MLTFLLVCWSEGGLLQDYTAPIIPACDVFMDVRVSSLCCNMKCTFAVQLSCIADLKIRVMFLMLMSNF